MSQDVELLSYKELADRLGVKVQSARQTVTRRRWKRIKGNDGAIRIEVPVEYLQRRDESSDIVSTEDATVDMSVEVARLTAENGYLKQRVADLEADRDRWHEMAVRPWWRRLMG